MSKCAGLHCAGCGHGGGGGKLWLLVAGGAVLAVAAAVKHRAVAHAAGAALHMVLTVLALAAVVMTVTVAALISSRIGRWQRRRARGAVRQVKAEQRAEIPAAKVIALPPAQDHAAPVWARPAVPARRSPYRHGE